jgi:hypothetical protein
LMARPKRFELLTQIIAKILSGDCLFDTDLLPCSLAE